MLECSCPPDLILVLQKSESDEELKTILNGLEQLSAEEVRWWVPPMHQGTLTQKETPGLSPGVPSAHVDDSHAAPDTAWLAPKPKTKRPPRTDPDKVVSFTAAAWCLC